MSGQGITQYDEAINAITQSKAIHVPMYAASLLLFTVVKPLILECGN